MTYSLEIKNLFLFKYLNGESVKTISKSLNIHHHTIYSWINKYDYNIKNQINVTEEKKENIPIRKSNKRYLYKNIIVEYVKLNNGCSLDDIYRHINMKISKTSIKLLLKENKITHKRFKVHIVGKSPEKINEERINFSKNLNINEYLNGIHIDESSVMITDHKNYGYSESGKVIKMTIMHKQNRKKITLLKAISREKIISYDLIDGTVNSEIYLKFIKKIKENELNKDKMIFQDNARIHHAKIIKEYALKENIKMKYNPAYSPEFNPIEYIFSIIKTDFRKKNHNDLKKDIIDSIESIKLKDLENCYEYSLKQIKEYL